MEAMSEYVLHDLDDYEATLKQHVRVLLFKHSPACPISAEARAEYDAFAAANEDVPTLFVDVIDDRAVARGIADRCRVVHQSPQAILFEKGLPVWHANHQAITRGALEAAFGCKC